MKRVSVFIFILLLALSLAGCRKASSGSLLLRLSDQRVAGEEVRPETTEAEKPLELVGSAGQMKADAATAGEDRADTSNEGQTDPEETTKAVETEAPQLKEPETDPPETEPPVTAPPETQAPVTSVPAATAPPAAEAPTTKAPATTPAPATTEAPTTKAPATTPAPTTTEAPTTTPAPTTTEPPTTTEDTTHTAANVDRIEVRTLPDKTFYDQYAEPISTKGMTLLATWADGYEKILTGGWTIVDGKGKLDPVTESEGEQTIYVYYGEKSTSFMITYRLSETAPLRVVDHYDPGRVFYQGEYVEHLISCAWVGNQRIETSVLAFSQERLDSEGTVTVEISYGKHTAKRTFTVVSGSLLVPTEDDLRWLFEINTTDSYLGMTLTASWFTKYALRVNEGPPYNRPVITSVIPDEEFEFEPAFLQREGVQYIQVTCRGVTLGCWADLY